MVSINGMTIYDAINLLRWFDLMSEDGLVTLNQRFPENLLDEYNTEVTSTLKSFTWFSFVEIIDEIDNGDCSIMFNIVDDVTTSLIIKYKNNIILKRTQNENT